MPGCCRGVHSQRRLCIKPSCVYGQSPEFDQTSTGDIAAQAQQFGSMYLVVMAELVSRAQQAVLYGFVQGARFFFEQLLKCTL